MVLPSAILSSGIAAGVSPKNKYSAWNTVQRSGGKGCEGKGKNVSSQSPGTRELDHDYQTPSALIQPGLSWKPLSGGLLCNLLQTFFSVCACVGGGAHLWGYTHMYTCVCGCP